MAGYELTPSRPTRAGTSTSTTCAAKVDEHTAGADAHEPVDARPLRREHRGDHADLPRAPARSCTTTARTSTRSAGSRGRATWASTSSTSTCTRRSRSRTAAAGPAAGRSRCATRSSRSCPCPRSCGESDGVPPRLRPAEDDRQGARLHRAVRRLRPLVRVHPHRTGRALREMSEVGRAERELPARAAARTPTTLPFDRLCMHEFVLSGARAQARARRHGARRRQAAHGLRLPSADDLLPADRPRGADDRADGDRGEGDARCLRRRDARDRARGGGAARAAEGGAARTGRSSGSTRCGPRSSPSCATASSSTRIRRARARRASSRRQKRRLTAALQRAARKPRRCRGRASGARSSGRRARSSSDSKAAMRSLGEPSYSRLPP